MLSLSFINHIVKESSTFSTVTNPFDSYYENLLKDLNKERRRVGQLSLQYNITESADINNVSIKGLLSHE